MIFDLTSRDLETSTIRDTIVEQASSQWEHTLQTRFFGEHNATTLAPAILALVWLGYEMDDIARFFEKVDLPCGRGNTLVGRKGRIVIDGTYNGGFASITAGLSMLADLGRQLGRPTIAIIWDMRELGDLEESYHQELAHLSKTLDLDNFIFVWPMCSTYIQPLFPDANYTLDAREAWEIVLKGVKNALIFAKWSQNTIFLEEALKQIILPEDSPKLVRQSEDWMWKKEAFYDSL